MTTSSPSTDQEHLRLLAIFHYVVGGLTALFSLFPLIHVAVGITILTSGEFSKQPDQPPVALFGGIFAVVGGLFFLCGEALAVAMIMAGRNIASRSRYLFVFVVACIECIFMPFGTALGIFTIIVLSRESVKALFAYPAPPEMPTR